MTTAQENSSTASGAGAAPALDLIDVTVSTLRDPSVEVLRDVQWTVQPGDYWAVAGLHRSGKSDLMAVAAGLMRAKRGTVRVFGRALLAGFEPERVDSRRPVGLVFDGGQLLHHLTLAGNIALPMAYHAIGNDTDRGSRLQSLIEFTGLESSMSRMPAQVSRNAQQRIGLARALALKPRLLLLDNPLTGLDPRDAAWWLDSLDALARGHALIDGEPLTLVVTGDDFRPWQNRAKQFALLNGTAFLALGGREQLRAHREPLLKVLLDAPGRL